MMEHLPITDALFGLAAVSLDNPSLTVVSLVPLSGGQRHVPDPGSQEPDEHGGVHRQGLLRGLHQVPEVPGHAVPEHARHLLENEGPREEAPGEKGEAG